MPQLKLPILLILGIWMGMLIGLSFIEAPLKFTAPNMTTKLGLGIGRIMFSVLNKVEVAFSFILILLGTLSYKEFLGSNIILLFTILIATILLQTLWFLPALDMRAERVLNNLTNPPSPIHLVYVVCEFVKLGLLLFLFKLILNNG